jgi:hypothetical protein
MGVVPCLSKAVFVDGPASNRVKTALGIGMFHFPNLYGVLVNKVGVSRTLAFPPVMTADPEKVDCESMRKSLAGAGFEIMFSTGRDQSDDETLKFRIGELDPAKVGEIVILTSDQDFVPVLKQKASHGMKVHWVSTYRPDPIRNRHCLSPSVIDLFKTGVFNFVDLDRFTGELSHKRRESDLPAGKSTDRDEVTQITLRLRSRDAQAHLKLAGAIMRLKSELPGLTVICDA